MRIRTILMLGLAVALAGALRAQQKGQSGHEGHGAQPQQELAHATEAMGTPKHDHNMGPHMQLTTLRKAQAGDEQRAREIISTARQAMEKYKDVRVAEKEGFAMFLPRIPQKMYHYSNWKYGLKSAFTFDPAKPTSLLYEKNKDGSFKLIGAMYTAPARLPEEQLNERIPLSVAQWHLHTNMCVPPKDKRSKEDFFGKNARFGLAGSITTREECAAAGGTFKPQVFGWMVHMYPYEKSMDAIWSIERQKDMVGTSGSAPAHKH